MDSTLQKNFLHIVRSNFESYKNLGASAIDVLTDEELNADPHGSNSVVIIVKHLHGNMRSRWTNLFTEDGEKPDRNRDGEFEPEYLGKERVKTLYAEGWRYLEKTLSEISDDDFSRPVIIRGETHTLIQAIVRQLGHSAYHVGQIVLIAKQCKGAAWKSLSIAKAKPPGQAQTK